MTRPARGKGKPKNSRKRLKPRWPKIIIPHFWLVVCKFFVKSVDSETFPEAVGASGKV
jgi:hypothetical protein